MCKYHSHTREKFSKQKKESALRTNFDTRINLTMESHDLHSAPEFEHTMDRRCQAMVSKLETSDAITFT